ncbi:MAG: hypothetical protein M3530_02750 [Thermoproteota archaeon]|nr:hypothetical protein [Thermoproteota archaeon]
MDWNNLWANVHIFVVIPIVGHIIFHKNEERPLVCHKCGSEIDWEGEYISRIKVCPKCNKEYDTNANYCPFHSPPVSLLEKEVEK